MFAQRFDPDAVAAPPKRLLSQFLNRKRKLSSASVSDEEKSSSRSDEESDGDSSSDSSSENNSESESDSNSESESESDSSSESDSQSESESENEDNNGDNVSQTEAMDIDEEEEIDQNETHEKEPEKAEFLQNVENDPAYVSKHASIFKKFQQAETSEQQPDEESEEVDMQDLAPIPQPELPRDLTLHGIQAHLKNLDWLSTPTYISPEMTEPFKALGLSDKITKNLALLGFDNAFSVQVGTLRVMMEDIRKSKLVSDFRGDLLVNASTGSGKTLAYLVSIIEALHTRVVPRLRAIILVPTRPLINQVSQTLRDISKGTVLTVVSLTSDLSIKEEGQKIQKAIPDIIVSTPGRLVDHLQNNSISLQYLRFLVVDEADRLLNQSFQNWCEVVVSNLDKWSDPLANTKWRLQTQKMIFSATLTTDSGKLSLLKFHKPRLLIVNSTELLVKEMFTLPATLSEHKIGFSSTRSAIKPLLLAKFLIHTGKLSSVLVFAQSNDATLRLSKILQALFDKFAPNNKINVAYMNSTNNKSSIRNRILEDFSTNSIHVLVATDLIARGLDILSITDVINYDLPNSSREYVHRVGRTARANKKGNAYTLCFGRGEEKWFRTIMRDVGRSKPIEEIDEESLGMVVDKQAREDFETVMDEFQS